MENCYVYRTIVKYEKDCTVVKKTGNFNLPLKRNRHDLKFLFITKRIDKLQACLPDDWGDGYKNVAICCTVEIQDRADYRLPIFLNAPIKHKMIVCEPLLEKLEISACLTKDIEQVITGGESGNSVRVCDYNWILSLREQCRIAGVSFHFKKTSAILGETARFIVFQGNFNMLKPEKQTLINIDSRCKSDGNKII